MIWHASKYVAMPQKAILNERIDKLKDVVKHQGNNLKLFYIQLEEP